MAIDLALFEIKQAAQRSIINIIFIAFLIQAKATGGCVQDYFLEVTASKKKSGEPSLNGKLLLLHFDFCKDYSNKIQCVNWWDLGILVVGFCYV